MKLKMQQILNPIMQVDTRQPRVASPTSHKPVALRPPQLVDSKAKATVRVRLEKAEPPPSVNRWFDRYKQRAADQRSRQYLERWHSLYDGEK